MNKVAPHVDHTNTVITHKHHFILVDRIQGEYLPIVFIQVIVDINSRHIISLFALDVYGTVFITHNQIVKL